MGMAGPTLSEVKFSYLYLTATCGSVIFEVAGSNHGVALGHMFNFSRL